jgi:hypothetical protein
MDEKHGRERARRAPEHPSKRSHDASLGPMRAGPPGALLDARYRSEFCKGSVAFMRHKVAIEPLASGGCGGYDGRRILRRGTLL